MYYSITLISIFEVLLEIVPMLLVIAYITVAERKTMASMQRRLGPIKLSRKYLLRDILSNSGDILKLMIPNDDRKIIRGLINYWCMVINQMMTEKKIGYCGSKLVVKKGTTVKEQRVYDSLRGLSPCLRCTLVGFERNYQVKILSKQINKLKYYTSISASLSNTNLTTSPQPSSPYVESIAESFITGFADGESSFIILILREQNNKTGWTVKARFSTGLHEKDLGILELIRLRLKDAGNISKQGKNSIQYRVSSLQDLINVVIPHFEKYPLITKKKADFILFKKAVDLIKCKEHLTREGIEKLVAIKASMNLGLSDELKAAFPEIVPIQRPLVGDQKITDPYWLAGFTSAEGCFSVITKKSSNFRQGFQVLLVFKLSQHHRDKLLLKSLIEYLGCGNVYKESEGTVQFSVTKYKDLTDKIIPFFDKYKVVGVKFQDYQDFKKVSELMKNRDHLTAEGLDSILKIKAGMAKGRNSI